jgi:hypothetical protein
MQSPFVFIVGSPRSGTTLLGEILDRHPDISQWYEPYFVWDRHFRLASDDERTAADVTPRVFKQIFSDFSSFYKRTGSRIVVDKSPRNSLKIPFIVKIFPEARFIHIIRDGRDATLSIHKEWLRRQSVVHGTGRKERFQYGRAFRVLSDWLGRQRFFRHKIRALWFETHFNLFNKDRHLNRLRWNGKVGWGPRFKDWDKYYRTCSLLQFNAYQWLKCVENIIGSWTDIRADHKLEIRYEDLITRPQDTIGRVMSFLGLALQEDFYNRIPAMKQDNFNKWKRELTRQQLTVVQIVIARMLNCFG